MTGTRPLLDLVTVVYTDAQGALQTEFNVALPWARTVTLDPGVELKSVTATSLTGQLNCAITDAAGAPLVAQANNSMITTCTQVAAALSQTELAHPRVVRVLQPVEELGRAGRAPRRWTPPGRRVRRARRARTGPA